MTDALLVFAKVPRPGEVKTRLTTALSPEAASRFYAAFLQDALDQYSALDASVRLYLAPPIPDALPIDVPAGISVHEQEGNGLGARMKNALQNALTDAARAVVIGTDHPTLPTEFVRRAFEALDAQPSVCIGPTDDGGFYLLGMNAFWPEPFQGMSYSHEDVFSDTLARIKSLAADVTVLPQWYDVDSPSDLRRLRRDVQTSTVEAARTRQMLKEVEPEVLGRAPSG